MKKLRGYTQEELEDILEEARQNLWDAINNLEIYVRATGDVNAQTYLVDQLRTHLEEGGMGSQNLTIETLEERLDEYFQDENKEEDEDE